MSVQDEADRQSLVAQGRKNHTQDSILGKTSWSLFAAHDNMWAEHELPADQGDWVDRWDKAVSSFLSWKLSLFAPWTAKITQSQKTDVSSVHLESKKRSALELKSAARNVWSEMTADERRDLLAAVVRRRVPGIKATPWLDPSAFEPYVHAERHGLDVRGLTVAQIVELAVAGALAGQTVRTEHRGELLSKSDDKKHVLNRFAEFLLPGGSAAAETAAVKAYVSGALPAGVQPELREGQVVIDVSGLDARRVLARALGRAALPAECSRGQDETAWRACERVRDSWNVCPTECRAGEFCDDTVARVLFYLPQELQESGAGAGAGAGAANSKASPPPPQMPLTEAFATVGDWKWQTLPDGRWAQVCQGNPTGPVYSVQELGKQLCAMAHTGHSNTPFVLKLELYFRRDASEAPGGAAKLYSVRRQAPNGQAEVEDIQRIWSLLHWDPPRRGYGRNGGFILKTELDMTYWSDDAVVPFVPGFRGVRAALCPTQARDVFGTDLDQKDDGGEQQGITALQFPDSRWECYDSGKLVEYLKTDKPFLPTSSSDFKALKLDQLSHNRWLADVGSLTTQPSAWRAIPFAMHCDPSGVRVSVVPNAEPLRQWKRRSAASSRPSRLAWGE